MDSFDSARPMHVVYPIRSGALIVAILGTDEADFQGESKALTTLPSRHGIELGFFPQPQNDKTNPRETGL